ncbi:MAG: hypothetical protein ACKOZV_17200 [Bacteroidota bacterium]
MYWQDPSDFLDTQWLASAVAIAVTYIVFIMGMPALMFQTFIPESFRNIYNERFNWKWENFFKRKLIILLILFLISDRTISHHISINISESIAAFLNDSKNKCCSQVIQEVIEAIIALLIFFIIAYIQFQGYWHLRDNFKSTRNAAQQISDEIARHAIIMFDVKGEVPQKDVEDLGILAKELDSGQIKNQFLDACESIIEHVMASPNGANNKDLIKWLVDSTICRSVLSDGAKADGSNRRRVLKTLMTVHKFKAPKAVKEIVLTAKEKKEIKAVLAAQKTQPSKPERDTNSINDYFLQDIVGNYIRDIGLQALREGDDLTLNDAIEKLYTIDSDPMELFMLANSAVDTGISHAYVAAIGKLEAKVRNYLTLPSNSGNDEEGAMRKFLIKRQRAIICITGLVSRIWQQDGAAREYALKVWKQIRQNLDQMDMELETHLSNTYKLFFKAADFTTADSVSDFKKYLSSQNS